jgi:hypothetical protein
MTPDGSESSEVEKLDSDIIPDYYPDDGHNMSTQSSNNATDSSMLFFTAQGNSYQGSLTLHPYPSLLTPA